VNVGVKEHIVRCGLNSASFSRRITPCCYFHSFVKFVTHDVLCVFHKIKSVPTLTVTPRACFSREILAKALCVRIIRMQQAPARIGLLVKDSSLGCRYICSWQVSLYFCINTEYIV
jgi:hypothetical protein